VEESKVELVEALMSKARAERGKVSAAKVKVKAMLKRMTAALKYPAQVICLCE
jgi:hypothetical protein